MAQSVAPLLVWVDAQLPPALARWIFEPAKVEALHISDVDLLTAEDRVIYEKARLAGAVLLA